MSAGPTESLLRTSVLASGLVTPEQLDYSLRVARHRQSQQGVSPNTEVDDALLAEILIEQKILTQYQANQLREGRTKLNLGPYICTDWIGQGGMGQVFKAVHRVMGRVCAVKVLPQARATQESLESFAREIQMQAGLDCPYLVRAFDAGHDGKVHYLVTEYVPGMDLRRLVKSRGPLPVQQCAQIIMQAALGLQYAHEAGLVHRDVKPGNILVTPEGDAKVSDVGLAGFAKDLINDPRAGKIVGTTDYLSPEQIRTPLEIQPASDIYSLGCTLYYAVCGKVPFPGGDTESKLRRHLYEYPLHPRNFVSDITEEFADIIVDMMEKDAKKRISSAAEVASRLQPWASENAPVGAVSIAPMPWMAPPPPGHGPVAESLSDSADASGTDVAESTQQVDGDHQHTPISDAPPLPSDPLPSPAPSPTLNTSQQRFSSGMIVALTLAIAVPPALLIGAIVGFLVRGSS
ncbi:MAG: hypothetical protein Aurels2KO_18840 [Aureliella sp.]